MNNEQNDQENENFIGSEHPGIPDWLRPHIRKIAEALDEEIKTNAELVHLLEEFNRVHIPDPTWAYAGIWDAVRRAKDSLQQAEDLLRQTEEMSIPVNQDLTNFMREAQGFIQVVLTQLTPPAQ